MSDENRSDLSTLINKVISNPEAMQTIMKLANDLKENRSDAAADEEDDEKETPQPAAGQPAEGGQADQAVSASANPHFHRGHRKRDDEEENRIRLLIALKPYLNEDRREKADIMIRLLKLLRFTDLNELSKLLGDLSK